MRSRTGTWEMGSKLVRAADGPFRGGDRRPGWSGRDKMGRGVCPDVPTGNESRSQPGTKRWTTPQVDQVQLYANKQLNCDFRFGPKLALYRGTVAGNSAQGFDATSCQGRTLTWLPPLCSASTAPKPSPVV